MEKIYGVSIGQMVTLWVFGAIGMFALLVDLDSYDPSPVSGFLLWLLPLVLVFYTTGWWGRNYGHLEFARRTLSYLEGVFLDIIFSRRFWIGVFILVATALVAFSIDVINKH